MKNLIVFGLISLLSISYSKAQLEGVYKAKYHAQVYEIVSDGIDRYTVGEDKHIGRHPNFQKNCIIEVYKDYIIIKGKVATIKYEIQNNLSWYISSESNRQTGTVDTDKMCFEFSANKDDHEMDIWTDDDGFTQIKSYIKNGSDLKVKISVEQFPDKLGNKYIEWVWTKIK